MIFVFWVSLVLFFSLSFVYQFVLTTKRKQHFALTKFKMLISLSFLLTLVTGIIMYS